MTSPSSPRSHTEKYVARLAELEALHHELEHGKRPGDGAVLAGLVLEAAGDVLRRKSVLGVASGVANKPLAAISASALRSWGEGVKVADLAAKLSRAASQAVEAALPDGSQEPEALAQWAAEDLQARDRLESALVALEALGVAGRADAKALGAHLRHAVASVDKTARTAVPSLTALNGTRRAEGSLLDPEFRVVAWWYTERTGIEDDGLVQILGGERTGVLPLEFRIAHGQVVQKRGRPVSFDDLLQLDLGLASRAEEKAILLQAQADPELKLALAAMEAAEAAIVQESSSEESALANSAVPAPVEAPKQETIAERPEFRVLLFRSPRSVSVVVQPHRVDRLAAAAVYRGDQLDRPFPSAPGQLGLHFELGAPERWVGAVARVVIKLTDGQTQAFEIRL